MAARDSDDDIRKYLPELSAILREADPARAKEKLTRAQDNPELDAALAQVPPQRPSERPSEASRWAAPPVGIAAGALPSSLAAPPVVKEREAPQSRRAPFSSWAKGIAAVIAAIGPVTLLWALLVRPNGREHVEPARAGASAGTSVPVAPTMSAAPVSSQTPSVRSVESAVPSVSAMPVLQEDAGTGPAVQIERDASAPKPTVKPTPSDADPYSTPPKKPGVAKPDAAPMIF